MRKYAWVTISKFTGKVRIAARRRDLTSGSEHLHGPFKIQLQWLTAELTAKHAAREARKAAA